MAIELDKLAPLTGQSKVKQTIAKNEIRPIRFDDYVGQKHLVKQLQTFLRASQERDEALDHILMYGPPGLGKTTLAKIIAKENKSKLLETSGPVLEKTGDLAAVLSKLEKNDVLFIDEIHRLSPHVEEVLYPAMEDFKIDIFVGEGSTAQGIKIDLMPFTLIGATTRASLLTAPLRDRFGISGHFEYYQADDLQKIIQRTSNILNIKIDNDSAFEIANRSRGTPRIANHLLMRVRDYAQVAKKLSIDLALTKFALDQLEINSSGLDKMQVRLLELLIYKFDGGPVGINTISASMGEEKDTIEDILEPYLVMKNYIKRTPRGREVTDLGIKLVEDKK